jgi:hypothetical protein
MTQLNLHRIEETDNLLYMLSLLSPDELETAARANFDYIKYPSEEKRLNYAREMAQRYLDSKSDRDKALTKMKHTIKFREDMDIDKLRDAATDPSSEYHIPLSKVLSHKQSFLQGYDKQGRSTYVFIPRLVQGHDPEWTRKGHVWTLERAIACSKAKDKTVNVIVDFCGFSIRQAPPTSVGVDIMTTLRDHYVGHVNHIFLIDAPMAFLGLWAIVKPFTGRKTQDKVHFVNSNRQKAKLIGRLYSNDQAASWMLPNGEKNRELDLDEYLQDSPFDRAFDE